MEGHEGIAMEWPASADASIETTLATRPREEFSIYNNPLVQLSPTTNTTFHFPMEGQPDSSDWIVGHPPDETTETKYGPNAPFWRTPCYTKILSPSCDKSLDMPTFPESQLLEWKVMVIINLLWKFPAPHLPTSSATAYGAWSISGYYQNRSVIEREMQ